MYEQYNRKSMFMEMKEYIKETFLFNDDANKKMLKKIEKLPSGEECIKYFSHLINSQYKWMARIGQDPNAQQMSWWGPIYPFDELEQEWSKSLQKWLAEIENKTEEQLFEEVEFIGFDGGKWKAKLVDIVL